MGNAGVGLTDKQRLAALVKPTNARSVLIRLADANGWTHGAEVGVLKGKTLFSMLDALPRLHMVAVDQWMNMPLRPVDCAETYNQWDMPRIGREVVAKAAQYGKRCRIIKADSVHAASVVADASMDFVFIDADHTEDGARRDIEAWRPKVRSGGMLLGHDIYWPTVRRVIDEMCAGWVDFGEEVWGLEI